MSHWSNASASQNTSNYPSFDAVNPDDHFWTQLQQPSRDTTDIGSLPQSNRSTPVPSITFPTTRSSHGYSAASSPPTRQGGSTPTSTRSLILASMQEMTRAISSLTSSHLRLEQVQLDNLEAQRRVEHLLSELVAHPSGRADPSARPPTRSSSSASASQSSFSHHSTLTNPNIQPTSNIINSTHPPNQPYLAPIVDHLVPDTQPIQTKSSQVDDDLLSLDSGASVSDDRSVQSVQFIAKMLRENQPKTIKFDKFDLSLNDPPAIRIWLRKAMSTIQNHSYFCTMIGPDGKLRDPPPPEEDAKLWISLSNSLPQGFLYLAGKNKSAAWALNYILQASKPEVTNPKVADDLYHDFLALKWNPKTSLENYAFEFARHIELLQDTDYILTPERIAKRWVASMPPEHFKDLQFAFESTDDSRLPPKWSRTTPLDQLLILTMTYIQQHHPLLVELRKKKDKDKDENDKNIRVAPPDGSTNQQWKDLMLSKVGKSDFQTFVNKVNNRAICPICLFASTAKSHHILADCRAYKAKLNEINPTTTTPSTTTQPVQAASSNNTNTNNAINHYSRLDSIHYLTTPDDTAPTKIIQEPISATPTLCFTDTGCKYHLFNDPNLFSDLQLFEADEPAKYVQLADETTTIPIIGQGCADIIISQIRTRIKISAYYVPSLPANFFSSQEHTQFLGCRIIGHTNQIDIHFPRFHFPTHANKDYGFHIHPGKHTTLPISFNFAESSLPTPTHASHAASLCAVTTRQASKLLSNFAEFNKESSAKEDWTIITGKNSFKPLETPLRHPAVSNNPYDTLTCPDDDDDDDDDAALRDNNIQTSDKTTTTKYSTPSTSPPPPLEDSSPPPLEDSSPPPLEDTVPDTYDDTDTVSDTSTIPDVEDIEQDTDKPTSPDNTTKQIHIDDLNALLKNPHPCNVFKYDTDTTDTDSHKAPASKITTTSVSENTTTSTIPTAPSPPTPESLESTLLRHLDKIKTNVGNSWHHHWNTIHTDSAFRSLLPSSTDPSKQHTKEELAVIHLLAKSLAKEAHWLLSSFPSDNSQYKETYISDVFNNPEQLSSESINAYLQHPRPIRPHLRPIDKVNATIPQHLIYSSEQLQKRTGFRNISNIVKHLKSVAAPTVTFSDLGKDPIKTRGEIATLNKKPRNTIPVERPDTFGEVFHYDIGYGAGTAIGGIRFALFIVDRKTRNKFIYPLKDTEGSTIRTQIQNFVREIGFFPKQMIADRDFKLIGGEVENYLRPFTTTSGAPPNRQNQNGLAEINWRYICDIARNYLAENLLPNKFWFYALRYAVQVSNYLPIQTDSGEYTTPHFEAYGVQPDYRKLIPLFSTAYVKQIYPKDGQKFEPHTIKAILIGNDDKSDCQLFYNPAKNSIISSADYTLDPTHPSGPLFNLLYDGGLQFQLYNPSATYDRPPTFDLQDRCLLTIDGQPTTVRVISTPTLLTPHYTVQRIDDTNELIDTPEHTLTALPQIPTSPTPS